MVKEYVTIVGKSVYRRVFTSIQNRKARLIHRCTRCKGIIDIGEVYTTIVTYRYGKGYRNQKLCLHHPINWKLERSKK